MQSHNKHYNHTLNNSVIQSDLFVNMQVRLSFVYAYQHQHFCIRSIKSNLTPKGASTLGNVFYNLCRNFVAR
jgi:hypothetical protein